MVGPRTDTHLQQLFAVMPRKLGNRMDEWLNPVSMFLYLLEPLATQRLQLADDGITATTRPLLPKFPNFFVELQFTYLPY